MREKSNCLIEKTKQFCFQNSHKFFRSCLANFSTPQPGTCPIEKGFCVDSNGGDQNSGVIQLNNVDGNAEQAQASCLKLCRQHKGATGCELIENRRCSVHTQFVAKGNGVDHHMCWIFSKCGPGIIILSSVRSKGPP